MLIILDLLAIRLTWSSKQIRCMTCPRYKCPDSTTILNFSYIHKTICLRCCNIEKPNIQNPKLHGKPLRRVSPMIIQDQIPNRVSAKAKNPWHGFGHAQKPQSGARLPHGNLFHIWPGLTKSQYTIGQHGIHHTIVQSKNSTISLRFHLAIH